MLLPGTFEPNGRPVVVAVVVVVVVAVVALLPVSGISICIIDLASRYLASRIVTCQRTFRIRVVIVLDRCRNSRREKRESKREREGERKRPGYAGHRLDVVSGRPTARHSKGPDEVT